MAFIDQELIDDPAMVDQAKRTYYKYNGKELVTSRPRGRPKLYRNPEFYSLETKTEAAAMYCVYGDTKEVAKLMEIDEKVIKQWKQEPWWFEVQKQIFVEQNEKLASQLSRTLDRTMEELIERLDNGDYTYNPKTGKVTRKPIEAKTIISIFDSLAHQRRITRGEPTSIAAKVGMDDRLNNLLNAFTQFANAKTVEGEIVNASDKI